jgi:hypothetical protein
LKEDAMTETNLLDLIKRGSELIEKEQFAEAADR